MRSPGFWNAGSPRWAPGHAPRPACQQTDSPSRRETPGDSNTTRAGNRTTGSGERDPRKLGKSRRVVCRLAVWWRGAAGRLRADSAVILGGGEKPEVSLSYSSACLHYRKKLRGTYPVVGVQTQERFHTERVGHQKDNLTSWGYKEADYGHVRGGRVKLGHESGRIVEGEGNTIWGNQSHYVQRREKEKSYNP